MWHYRLDSTFIDDSTWKRSASRAEGPDPLHPELSPAPVKVFTRDEIKAYEAELRARREKENKQ